MFEVNNTCLVINYYWPCGILLRYHQPSDNDYKKIVTTYNFNTYKTSINHTQNSTFQILEITY